MNRRRDGTPRPGTPQPSTSAQTPTIAEGTAAAATSTPVATGKKSAPQPIPKFDLSKLDLKEIPVDGEWCCHWVNDTPIGREGYLLNADGNKRPTVLVDDWRLPAGWTKHLYQRSSISGKWDVVLVGPTNKRFRSKNDVKVYLEEIGQVYNPDVYDFSIHKRRAKDLQVYIYTDGYVPPNIPKPPSLDYSNVDVSTTSFLDTSLECKQEPFTGFAPIESLPLLPALSSSLNSTLNLDTSTVGSPIAAATPNQAYPLEEGFAYVGALKVQIINNLYRCPNENCGKNFRKDINLQMHVKHYHRELSDQLGVCPKVTDLAYFRTVGEEMVTTPKTPAASETPGKLNRTADPFKTEAKDESNVPASTSTLSSQDQRIHEILKRKPDADIKNDDIKEKKPTMPGDIQSASVLTSPPKTTVDAAANDALIKTPPTPTQQIRTSKFPLVALRKFKIGQRLSRKIGRPRQRGAANLSKLKKIKREFINSTAMMYKDRHSGSSAPQTPSSSGTTKQNAYHSGSSLDVPSRGQRFKYFGHQTGIDSKSNLYDGPIVTSIGNQRFISENGEVIKIVRMRQEEIINCLCGFGEEDGLMIQCELCLCWQHGACNGIEKECQVPEKYVCYICKNPTLGRKSMKFIHDQDWLYEGRLPHANYHAASKNTPQRSDVLKQSHTLLGNMLELKKSLHSLNVKINIAANKDHPKMYLWAKSWDDGPSNEANRKPSAEPTADQVVPKAEPNEQQATQKAASGAPTAPSSSGSKPQIQPNIPEPEAAINSTECQKRLLDHIQKQQNLIMSRMQSIDAQIIGKFNVYSVFSNRTIIDFSLFSVCIYSFGIDGRNEQYVSRPK